MRSRSTPSFATCLRIYRLVAAASFVLILLGSQRLALAARVPAPMCTPDAQSMPAPLQRTPTSAAEIRSNGCPAVQGPSWEALPNQPSMPLNWYQCAADPLWIGQAILRASKAITIAMPPETEPQRLIGGGFVTEAFRPPRGESLSTPG